MAILIHCFMGISILSSVIGEVAVLSVSYSGMIFFVHLSHCSLSDHQTGKDNLCKYKVQFLMISFIKRKKFAIINQNRLGPV